MAPQVPPQLADTEHKKHPTPTPAPPVNPDASTYTLLTEPDQGLQPIYDLLSSATKSTS